MWKKFKCALARAKTWLWTIAGNSKTLAVAYAVELLSLLDEAKVVPWSELIGVERGGRVSAIVTTAFIFLRVVTKGPTTFKVVRPK